ALLKGHVARERDTIEPSGRGGTGPHRASAPPDLGLRRSHEHAAIGTLGGRGDDTTRQQPVRPLEERRTVRPNPTAPRLSSGEDEAESKLGRPAGAKPKEV